MTEKKGIAKGAAAILRMIQHICMACMVGALIVVIVGSNLQITSLQGTSIYNLFYYDSGNEYQDTVLVNSILGKDVSDILRFGAIAEQLETNGKYDAKKMIDVVGYNYRDADLPSEYITANYYLEDLLKWGKFGVNNPFDNRYKTVDGKNIEEIVTTSEEYDSLVKHIKKASEDLYVNYKEYLAYKNYYTTDHSNLRYCVVRKGSGYGAKTTIFSNVDTLKDGSVTPEIYFKNLMSYIQYVPSELIYNTNSSISEQTFRNLEMQYSYAYSEKSEVWIGIDNVYENGIADEFGQAQCAYDRIYKVLYPAVSVAITSAVIYAIILIYLTVKEGRRRGKTGKPILTQFDLISTEAYLVVTAIFVAIVCTGIAIFIEVFMPKESVFLANLYDYIAVFAITAFLCDIIGLFLYYSFIRRCKTGVLWRHSYIVGGIKKIVNYLRKVFGNAPLAARVFIPFGLLAIVNLIAIKIGSGFFVGTILIDALIAGYLFEEALKRQEIMKGIHQISGGDFTYRADVEKLHGDNKVLGQAVNSIGDGIKVAVETSMKDERMKSDLITNVSHDIKTPLTSIISYVDLLKREKIEDEKVRAYIQVLDEKSQRLKQLTDDLVEASKISSGNIVLQMEKINLVELMNQSIAEFDEKFDEKGLQVVVKNNTTNPNVCADSRRIWRVMENLFTNIYKYSLEQTRVYVDLSNSVDLHKVVLVMKNISADSLNCDPKELTERFIRGDESRTTEGSGLGLSIAKNLVEIQKGQFEIQLDGDLFKVQITFPVFTDETRPGIITVEMDEEVETVDKTEVSE